MTRLQAYITTKFFPIKRDISKKEYISEKEALSEEEFSQKYKAVDSGLGFDNYYHIIAKKPEGDDLNTLLLYEIYEKLSSMKRQEVELLQKQTKLQTIIARKVSILLTITIVMIVLSVIVAIVLSTSI